MCRSIKVLRNQDLPATPEEVRGAALQFVRKISGFQKPSGINEEAFNEAVEGVSLAAKTLLQTLVTAAPPKSREAEEEKMRARNRQRFRK